MKRVLVLGAGRSSSALIGYLLNKAAAHELDITVGDFSLAAARERVGNHPSGQAIAFDINQEQASEAEIAAADVVISLLPANLHPRVAALCLKQKKHLLTASYVSDEMRGLHDAALRNNLLFLNECGLDPGIDHMSAMHVIDRVRKVGGRITSFESFTGGLIAPETDPENPWRYKFTWNARNVVMAGQGTAKFLLNGEYKYIPYQQLFSRTTSVTVPGYGNYEGYANRDSLKYIEAYGLQGIQTMLRGTLRHEGFCAAWNALVQLGCCDDTYQMERVATLTHRSFLNAFLDDAAGHPVEEKLRLVMGWLPDAPEMKKLRWSGLLSEEPVGLTQGTPAQILEHILNKKWKLAPADKDMIVMWHRFGYEQNGRQKEMQAWLVVKGDDSIHTAMAKTVGLPLGIASLCLLQGKIKTRGVALPIVPEIYEPVLTELSKIGIELEERETK
ncbi:MAG: saccharopine dehydrogenase family protein [Bacteroidota bacterium]